MTAPTATRRRRSRFAIALVALGWAACNLSPRPGLAQAAAGGTPASVASAAPEDAEARAARFVNAVKEFTAADGSHQPGASAFLMLDIPKEAPRKGEQAIAIEFRAIRADTLATFYAKACGPDGPRIDSHCESRRLTIPTTEKLPQMQACRFVEAALLAACAPPE